MKRDVFFHVAIFFLLFCVLLNQFISAETVVDPSLTGNMVVDPITGQLTSQQVGLSIFIQTVFPYIELFSPKNETYLRNESILLNYTVSDGDYIWYNLDNSQNITLYSPINLSVSQGQHTLYIFANKSDNVTTASVKFIANSSRFIIFFEKYKGITKGSSTNFLDYTYEDIQNLQSITIENTSYGKIIFREAINMTNDKINTDNFLDLDSNTNISFNHIEVNSQELPNFNTSATLWMYGLNFVNPRILKDGVICPSNVCIKEAYTYPSGNGWNGILKFNVTSFSAYTAEETPATNNTNPPSGGNNGGGGGSGGDITPTTKETIIEIVNKTEKDNITVISREIKVSLAQGETATQSLYILNNYNSNMKIKIDTTDISEFITLSEREFELSPQESKTIKINFTAGENTPPDTYIGRILVETSDGEIYEVFVYMDVQSKESLFDVIVSLNEKKLPVVEGGALWFTTTIHNLGDERGINVNIKYTIKDSNGKIIFEGEGTDKIDDYLEKNGKIKLPKDTALGKYVLSVRVNYKGRYAITSASFEVKERKWFTIKNILIAIGILILILIILGIIGKRERKKAERERERKMETLEN